MATQESVAQHFENVIWEDLRDHPEIQRKLGIEDVFSQLYQEFQDISQIREYQVKHHQYAIAFLADESSGDPNDPEVRRRKHEIIREVELMPTQDLRVVDSFPDSFDAKGNFKIETVKELMYCAQPVQRILQIFEQEGIRYEGKGRSLIDKTILNGFWTPQGLIDNAKIVARDYAAEQRK